MEYQVKVVPSELLMEPLLGLMEESEYVPLVISGGSMTPFLSDGRDTVYLSRIRRELKRGDIVLYQRETGGYVLHRILRVDKDSYTMIGDAQIHPEPGICREQILAIVTAVRRKDKLLQNGSFWWFFFEKIWIRMVPARPAVRKMYTIIRRRMQ